MKWNAALYDEKHNFIAEYGKGLLAFVPENNHQSILDLGCGTGTLTVQLAELADRVVGMDSAQSMIDTAKAHFSDITFMVGDALALPFEAEFDVVFSNAVFHWINDHDLLLKNIHKALKPHGALICEFGAEGNIATIDRAFSAASQAHGYTFTAKFNFPASAHFAALLEANGFVIEKVYDFDRPTPLKDGADGLANWLKQFYASELAVMPATVQNAVLRETEAATRDALWNGAEWIADYRRLRAIAHKAQ